MKYRLVIQFAKGRDEDGRGNWETVAAPVFATRATEEEVYGHVRAMIARLPAGLPDGNDTAVNQRDDPGV
jgi:hypothetical protein